MADNPLGTHIQGCQDEGTPADTERPVLVAFEGSDGNIEVPNLLPDGSLPVTINAGGGGPVTIADCADVTQGCIADAAVTGDNPGTISAKIRGLNKLFFDVWDSVNHWLRVGAAQVGVWTVAVNNFPATQPVSGTVTANQGAPGGTPWLTDTPDLTASGTITANGQTVPITLLGSGSCTVAFSGVWTGSMVAEGSNDGGITFPFTPPICQENGQNTSGGLVSGSNIHGTVNVAGLSNLRIRATSAVTGTLTVSMRASIGSNQVRSEAIPITAGSTTLADVGLTRIVPVNNQGTNLYVPVFSYMQNGTSNATLPRTPNIFKTVQATAAGSTALWTPAAGKKFRLMRWIVEVTDNATLAVAGVLTIKLLDAAGDIAQNFDIFVPSAALNSSGLLGDSKWNVLDNGILSAVANNVLNVNLSAALVIGSVRVRACGTEE